MAEPNVKYTIRGEEMWDHSLISRGRRGGEFGSSGHVSDPSGSVESPELQSVSTVREVRVREATRGGYCVARTEEDSVNFTFPESNTRRGRVGVGVAQTLDTACNQGIFVELAEGVTAYAVWYEPEQCYIAIRRLTPRECFRLQGWTDDYFEKAEFVNSDSQLYKQAGNGVTVPVIEAIARRLENATEEI